MLQSIVYILVSTLLGMSVSISAVSTPCDLNHSDLSPSAYSLSVDEDRAFDAWPEQESSPGIAQKPDEDATSCQEPETSLVDEQKTDEGEAERMEQKQVALEPADEDSDEAVVYHWPEDDDTLSDYERMWYGVPFWQVPELLDKDDPEVQEYLANKAREEETEKNRVDDDIAEDDPYNTGEFVDDEVEEETAWVYEDSGFVGNNEDTSEVYQTDGRTSVGPILKCYIDENGDYQYFHALYPPSYQLDGYDN